MALRGLSDGDRQVTVGLEIHVRLLTPTKLFCGCANRYGAPANTLVCPVCLGLPGSLPVLQPGAAEQGWRVGLALGCDLARRSIFARKNYFYPDLPRNYQITQYDDPLGREGGLRVGDLDVRLRRIHLEEDAGRTRDGNGTQGGVDLNRAGTPLLEIVTEPDLPDGRAAADWLRRLRQILLYLEVTDGRMAEGSLRCDANVGLAGAGALIELKNLNSFRSLQRAVDLEARRLAALPAGDRPAAETRTWDEKAGTTRHLRYKESTADYRYFREPDLPPLLLPQALRDQLAADLPRLPDAREAALMSCWGLAPEVARLVCREPDHAAWFEALVEHLARQCAETDPETCGALASDWFANQVLAGAAGDGEETFRIPAQWLAGLLALLLTGRITGTTAKRIFAGRVAGDPRDAETIVAQDDLAVLVDPDAVARICREVLARHPQPAQAWRDGRSGVLEFLMGKVMAATAGRADPELVRNLLVDPEGKNS